MVHIMQPHPAEAADKVKSLQEQIDDQADRIDKLEAAAGRLEQLQAQVESLIEAQPRAVKAKLDKDESGDED